MIIRLIGIISYLLLRLRYRIKVIGYEKIEAKKGESILFLPNHPALIDPVLTYSLLQKRFRPRALIDENQLKNPIMGFIGKEINALAIPDLSKVGPKGKDIIHAALNEIVESLKRGESMLLYPAGQIYRKGREDLRGASAVFRILNELPNQKIVLTQPIWLSVAV